MKLLNYALCVILIAAVVFFIGILYRRARKFAETLQDGDAHNFTYSYLARGVDEYIKEIVYARPEDMNVTYEEARKRREMKVKMSNAKRDAPVNKLSAKIYLTTQISRILEQNFFINPTTIDQVFPFREPEELDDHIRFLVLMFTVMEEYGTNAWLYLMKENHLDEARDNGRFEIYQSDIDMMFHKYVKEITYDVKKSVLTQKIYEDKYGDGDPDLLIWQNIEDITLGLGGIAPDYDGYLPILGGKTVRPEDASYNRVVILSSGRSVHLRFTGLKSQKELERVCRHIYQYRNPGELTESSGFIENQMADGSRVVVFRDGFGDAWGCCIRKHKEGSLMHLEELYHQNGCEDLFALLTGLMIGCQSCIISGGMYTGKTTLLTALVEKINPNYNLRGLESVFEMMLRNLFPDRDIGTFMERTDIPGDKVLEFLKRTNGTVLLLGELLKEVAANWLISAGQSGFKFVMSTTHAISTEALIKWLLNAKLNTSGAGNTQLAIEDIINAIHFDVHCALDEIKGERYVERVTEIVPTHDERLYEIRDIIRFDFEEHCYRVVNPLSQRTLDEIHHYMVGDQWSTYLAQFGTISPERRQGNS